LGTGLLLAEDLLKLKLGTEVLDNGLLGAEDDLLKNGKGIIV